jgi:hypothetical protein
MQRFSLECINLPGFCVLYGSRSLKMRYEDYHVLNKFAKILGRLNNGKDNQFPTQSRTRLMN